MSGSSNETPKPIMSRSSVLMKSSSWGMAAPMERVSSSSHSKAAGAMKA